MHCSVWLFVRVKGDCRSWNQTNVKLAHCSGYHLKITFEQFRILKCLLRVSYDVNYCGKCCNNNNYSRVAAQQVTVQGIKSDTCIWGLVHMSRGIDATRFQLIILAIKCIQIAQKPQASPNLLLTLDG